MTNSADKIMSLIQQQGVIRPRDVEALNIPRMYLQRLYERGEVERVGHGLYALPDTLTDIYSNFAEVTKRVPKGVICLISALRFHELTTQLPFQVWLAIEGTSWKPQVDYPPVNVRRFSGEAFHYGIEVHEIESVPVRLYSIPKTIADCFKFRNKIGLDVALEALRDALQHKRTTIHDIWKAAKVCRVSNVMKPYLEAM